MRKRGKKEETEQVNFLDMALLEDELCETEKAYGQERELKLWQRLGDRYFAWRENRQKHMVNRRWYLFLTLFLGWAGIHRFYERRWILGLCYLGLSWTGFPVMMAVVDLMIALPMRADEKGSILI